MNGVLAGMVIVAIIALVAETLITLLEKRILRWRAAVELRRLDRRLIQP